MTNNHSKLVQCVDCGKTFETSIKNTTKIIRCPDCRIKYKRQRERERDQEKRKLIYFEGPFICEYCGREFNDDYRKTFSSRKRSAPRFCGETCAKSYAASKITPKTKLTTCPICKKEFSVDFRASTGCVHCPDCRTKKIKEKTKERAKENKESFKYSKNCILGKFERSGFFVGKTCNLQKLGFDFNKDWEEEFFRIRNLLYDLYYVEYKSTLDITRDFGISCATTTRNLMHLFGLRLRTSKESVLLASTQGKINRGDPGKGNYLYKAGTLSQKENSYYYRSSYELEFSNFLNSENIDFTLNEFKIKYKSSVDGLFHTGYPDFFLPQFNLVVEMKSNRNYDEQNLKDRFEVIKNMGYDFLVLSASILYRKKGHVLRGFKIMKDFSKNSNPFLEILKEKLA